MVDAIKAGIISMMKANSSTSGHIESINAILDSEFGSAFISYLLGTGLMYAPNEISTDARAMKLATEFRVGGMATAGNAVIDSLTENVMSTIMSTMESLPSLSETEEANARVEPVEDLEVEKETELKAFRV